MYISLVITTAVLAHAWSGVQCAPLCLSGDFDSQLQHILHEQMLSEQDPANNMISRVLDDVRTTLNQRWQGYELIVCGSLATGLGTILSDVDLVVHLPNFNDSAVITTAVLAHAWSGVQCAPLCLSGDFDSQLQHILHEQMLSEQDPANNMISRVLDDVRTTLNQRWQGYELIVCGSLATGLGTILSDVDLVVHLPNFNDSAGIYVLQETKELFSKQPELYSRLKYRKNVGHISTFFSCFHIPSQHIVEIEFQTGDYGVSNSQLVKYYFQLDKRFLPLGGFLKYWFKTHRVIGHGRGFLPNYGLYLLTIFYLQQKNMAPPGYVLQVDSKSNFIDDWDMGFNELPYTSSNTENLYQLLGGFFKYYSEFNFEEYIVAPFTGRPIPRSAFKDIGNFPKEYTSYNKTLKRTSQLKIQNDLNLSTDICIQDVFTHDLNSGHLLSHERATKFKNLMKSVAKMFEDLPSDSILRAILVTDQHKETVINYNNATVDGINEQDCTK